jgi:hypothetical protein
MTSLALTATKSQYDVLPTGQIGALHEKPQAFVSVLLDGMQEYVHFKVFTYG